MATTTSHNKKSSAVKRILSEARELEADGSDEYEARPLESNIFEWHFTLRGPSGTEFEEGLYHGRVLLPVEYPFRPPDLMLLTPNGRWECNKKICLTFTGYHESMWQPAWGIRTALLGVQGFMSARAEAATGVASVDYPIEERRRLARKSRGWACSDCGKSNVELLPDGDPDKGRKKEKLPEGLEVNTLAEKTGGQVESKAEATSSGGITPEAPQSQTVVEDGRTVSSAVPIVPKVAPSDQDEGSGSLKTASLPLPDDQAKAIRDVNPPDHSRDHSSASQAPSGLTKASSHPVALNSLSDPPTEVRSQGSFPATPPPHSRQPTTSVEPIPGLRLRQAPQEPLAEEEENAPLPAFRRGVPAEELPAPRRPTRSEARVAQLDRAIITVVLLLCGLVVRRLI